MRQLLRFAWVEAQCCLFAVLFFIGLGTAHRVLLPGSPADALLRWCLAVTLGLWLAGWETGRDVAVIVGFHLVGLALELWKADHGSWSYPDTGVSCVGGVPLSARGPLSDGKRTANELLAAQLAAAKPARTEPSRFVVERYGLFDDEAQALVERVLAGRSELPERVVDDVAYSAALLARQAANLWQGLQLTPPGRSRELLHQEAARQ